MTSAPRLWTSFVPADASFPPDRVAVSAIGHSITYADGSSRLCATSGLWNVPLGYGNEAVAEAVARATRDSSYLSLFRAPHRWAIDAADALIALAGADSYERVVFSTSGGAANDAMMKLVRQYWTLEDRSPRSVVVGLRDSYHGTMYGSHALSADELLQPVYGLDRRTLRHVAHDDGGEQLELLLRREHERVAAVVVEPVLGSGAVALDAAFVDTLLALRDQYGFLVVADEVATGFGRTGRLFASDAWPSPPDVMVVSKALTNGAAAASALLIGPRISRAFARAKATFVHGETQAGMPAAAASVVAVIDELTRMSVLTVVASLTQRLDRTLDALVHDGYATGSSGVGCFRGLRIAGREAANATASDVASIVTAVSDAGVIVHPGPGVIQLIPPYGLDDDEIRVIDRALRAGIDAWRAAA